GRKESLHAQGALEPRFVDREALVGGPAVDAGNNHRERLKVNDRARAESGDHLAGTYVTDRAGHHVHASPSSRKNAAVGSTSRSEPGVGHSPSFCVPAVRSKTRVLSGGRCESSSHE